VTIEQGFIVGGTVPWRESLAVAGDVGFDYVELDMEQALPHRTLDVDGVESALAANDLEAVVHLPYRLDPGSPHEHVREGACRELEAAIDVAADLGATKGVFHAKTDGFRHVWGDETLRACLFDSVRRLNASGEERGVEVCVENLKQPFFDAGDFPALFESTDAAACLDTGHAYVSGLTASDQAALLRDHPERVSHVHLNDTRHDGDDEHLPVGLGRLAFDDIVTAMRETGWTGTCTHELYHYDLAYAAPSKAAFDRLLDGAD
jgi:sugar phosphate isomerase/epimerase